MKRFIPVFKDLDWRLKKHDDFPRNMMVAIEDRKANEIADCEKFVADNYDDFLNKSGKFIDEFKDLYYGT